MLACGTYAGASHLWLKIPLSIQTWAKWIIVSIVIAVILAALGMHAWDKPDHDTDITSTPDMEWYSIGMMTSSMGVYRKAAQMSSRAFPTQRTAQEYMSALPLMQLERRTV